MQVGTRVRYIREDNPRDKASGYYPPINTLGTIITIDDNDHTYQVRWDKGTIDNGIWWCNFADVEKVEDNTELYADLRMEQQEQM